MPLAFFRGVELGVLGDVAMCAGDLDLLDDLEPIYGFQATQLFIELRVPCARHGNSIGHRALALRRSGLWSRDESRPALGRTTRDRTTKPTRASPGGRGGIG